MIDKRRRPRTKEEKQKISEATKRAMKRPEVQEKLAKPRPNGSLSKFGTKNPMYGKQVSEETRTKRRATIGKKHTGETNPSYKGEEAGASAIHIWINRRHPRKGTCENCGRIGYTEYAFLLWPESHTRNREDYQEMCRSCHTKYDKATGQRS